MTDKTTEFPKSEATVQGMKTLPADPHNVRARVVPVDHVYTRKNGQNLRVRLIYPDQGDDSQIYPLVVHIQGSAWFQQDLYDHMYDFEKNRDQRLYFSDCRILAYSSCSIPQSCRRC
ncbi:hypothetical protein GCM10008932_00370 [Alkalibacterium iburiense]|uniref:Uncharacterized protein n=1 Tax=Alkalibacterium iburiense TaxID=290589 RepID=A0ABN0X0B7_9LACT